MPSSLSRAFLAFHALNKSDATHPSNTMRLTNELAKLVTFNDRLVNNDYYSLFPTQLITVKHS